MKFFNSTQRCKPFQRIENRTPGFYLHWASYSLGPNETCCPPEQCLEPAPSSCAQRTLGKLAAACQRRNQRANARRISGGASSSSRPRGASAASLRATGSRALRRQSASTSTRTRRRRLAEGPTFAQRPRDFAPSSTPTRRPLWLLARARPGDLLIGAQPLPSCANCSKVSPASPRLGQRHVRLRSRAKLERPSRVPP